MIIKSVQDIRTEMLETFSSLLPNLDLTEGTPERDLFVEVPIAGQLSGIWNGLTYTQKLHAPLVYYPDLDENEIDKFCATYNVIQRAGTYSIGSVTFYTNSEPTSDITINDGDRVSTVEVLPTEFEVDGTYTIYEATKNSYYNAATDRWEIECNIKAVEYGPDYRAGTGTVTQIVSSINGIDGCINDSPIAGGEEAETIEERLRRVNEKFQGRDLGSSSGIRNYLGIYTRYINLVGANNPLMQRDEGLGGAIDIYIIGENLETTTDTVNITSSGLATPINVNYTSTTITLSEQPVHQITSVIKNAVVMTPSYYTLTQDTGVLKKSTSGYDKLTLTSSGLINVGAFAGNDIIKITYNYNKLLTTMEEDLNSEANHFENRDYLLREMDEIAIDGSIRFKEVSGQVFDTVKTSVELAISTFIADIKNSGNVELADIIGIVKNHAGVDNIDLTTADISTTDSDTETAQGDIIIENNQYPVAGTFTLTRWTN